MSAEIIALMTDEERVKRGFPSRMDDIAWDAANYCAEVIHEDADWQDRYDKFDAIKRFVLGAKDEAEAIERARAVRAVMDLHGWPAVAAMVA